MDDKRRIKIMRNALNTILLEAKEPIMKVVAQSAIDETVDDIAEVEKNNHCKKHNWFGLKEERCPLCTK